MTRAQSLKIKIQLYCGDEIAMGPGKAALLDAIAAQGSISAAARSLGMSYRRAWLLVNTMNRCWKSPLIETSPGNARGGGARVSDLGGAVLAHYRAVQLRVSKVSDCTDSAALADAMLSAPAARSGV